MTVAPSSFFGRFCAALLGVSQLTIAHHGQPQVASDTTRAVYEAVNQNVIHILAQQSSSPTPTITGLASTKTPTLLPSQRNILHDLHGALSTMQTHYFALWLGKWTTAIDWTAAVMGSHLSSTLLSLSQSTSYSIPGTFNLSETLDLEAQLIDNQINKYFAQLTAYYFGEDHFAIRLQAYDDMLWVVLGWLDATRFIESHAWQHYSAAQSAPGGQVISGAWHGQQFIPAFAHRARVFYELAANGWDWRLCGGGMTWNPRLLPYKNAITNELFISASVGMYLHFPGDENCSPYLGMRDNPAVQAEKLQGGCEDGEGRKRYDEQYLTNAIDGYDWLRNSRMLNEQGLYTDGFHISGYAQNHSKTTCDERNDMVYTYNQGVVLSGLRGLWEATGNTTYLAHGHELVRNVINATGWHEYNPFTPSNAAGAWTKPQKWAGLGSNGILTELCDPFGNCNQNGQTFKGIFFHHLTAFCTSLPTRPVRAGKTFAASPETARRHRKSCDEYVGWVSHNARAALRTRDRRGLFGSWWGAGDAEERGVEFRVERPDRAVDWRNKNEEERWSEDIDGKQDASDQATAGTKKDPNDRGRGRTVESQGSGLAVVRSMWEFARRAEEDVNVGL